MNYYISRDGQQFGPYTLAEVQRYVADGNILLTDLAHSEGMDQWVPVRQILGNIPAQPAAPSPVAPNYGSVPVYPQSPLNATPQAAAGAIGPLPPDLHWALVLLFSWFTCGIFSCVWMFIQASYVKKIRPDANCLLLYGLGIPGFIVAYIVILAGAGAREDSIRGLGGLLWLAAIVLIIVGNFSLKDSLEEYYNLVEPLNLRLSGVMTFFFNVFYFQYHLSRIRQYKVTGFWR